MYFILGTNIQFGLIWSHCWSLATPSCACRKIEGVVVNETPYNQGEIGSYRRNEGHCVAIAKFYTSVQAYLSCPACTKVIYYSMYYM